MFGFNANKKIDKELDTVDQAILNLEAIQAKEVDNVVKCSDIINNTLDIQDDHNKAAKRAGGLVANFKRLVAG